MLFVSRAVSAKYLLLFRTVLLMMMVLCCILSGTLLRYQQGRSIPVSGFRSFLEMSFLQMARRGHTLRSSRGNTVSAFLTVLRQGSITSNSVTLFFTR